MIKILLLSAGTNACYHVAKTLKEFFKNDFYIIGADINNEYLISGCHFLDKFYKVPPSKSPNYYNEILNILDLENADYILPIFDSDNIMFNSDNPDLLKRSVKSLGISSDTAKIYTDKLEMYKVLIQKGFAVPKIFDLEDIKDEEKYFIKPLKGAGSIGAKLSEGKDIKNMSDVSDILIQEVCEEPEYTVECFNYNGIFRAVTRERIASKAGVCVKTRIFNHSDLEKIAYRFSQEIKCPICYNLQFMRNSDGDFVITDVNLRLAGGMSLSAAAGWDEVCALAKILLNRSENDVFETLPEKIQPQYIVRAYTDIVTKFEKPVVAFDFDGTLLDSRQRHIAVLNDILEKYEISVDTQDLIEFKRMGKNNVDYLVSKNVPEQTAKQIQAQWIENIENDEYLVLDRLYPNAIELLEQYGQENDLILVSARKNVQGLLNQVKNLNIENYFMAIKAVNPCNSAAIRKAEILKEYNSRLMIGDTTSDAKAAELAGTTFLHVDTGFHSKELLTN